MSPLDTLYPRVITSAGISTDTRSLKPGQVFLALKGPSFDGNRFAEQALAAGATLAIVDDAAAAESLRQSHGTERVAQVADALDTLHELARHHRRQLTAPVVGLTGSNGKTTTKELLRAALSTQLTVWATPANRNNHIGLPLTLLEASPAHQIVVLEMGDNHPGEIDQLCRIAEPTHGLITNVGLDHLAGYASQAENIATKLELFDWLRSHQGEAFVNLGDPALAAYAKRHPMVTSTFGTAKADLWADRIESSLSGLRFRLHWRGWPQPVPMLVPLYGRYNLENLLGAAAVAIHFGVGPENLQEGLAAYHPTNNRSQVFTAGALTVVMDAYNANPSSMQAALDDFVALEVSPKAVLLGDMLELGDQSADEHRKLGLQLASIRGLRCLLIGPEMKAAADALPASADVHYFADRAQAQAAVPLLLRDMHAVLVKGSRGMALEELLKPLLHPTA